MHDNISDEAEASQNEANAPEAREVLTETTTKQHTSLAESELEASMSDVLPLSPIGGVSENTNVISQAPKKSGERHGLRRGNAGGRAQSSGSSASVGGLIENPAEFKETLSGTGVRPQARPHGNFQRRERNDNADQVANEKIREKIEEARNGGSWRIREKPEKTFHHPQSNTRTSQPKLVIEPAPLPEQKYGPSLFERLKTRILAIFGIGKKKGKKNRRRRHGKKFYGNENNRFRNDFRNGGNGKNFDRNRQRNSGFRGNNRRFNKNGNSRPQNGGGNAPTPKA